eukprot:scaffold76179_cov17-Tisochrysis_lutea.AAC.1
MAAARAVIVVPSWNLSCTKYYSVAILYACSGGSSDNCGSGRNILLHQFGGGEQSAERLEVRLFVP